jgi:hypothetical protein
MEVNEGEKNNLENQPLRKVSLFMLEKKDVNMSCKIKSRSNQRRIRVFTERQKIFLFKFI